LAHMSAHLGLKSFSNETQNAENGVRTRAPMINGSLYH
jgi:hypothetical protein